MPNVPLYRLYLLRGAYLLLVVGLGLNYWSDFLFNGASLPLMDGVVYAILTTVSILAIIGLRYPLKMLPVLLFETIWKALWLALVALPKWRANQINADVAEVIYACALGIIFPLVIPWRYVVSTYIRNPGDHWK